MEVKGTYRNIGLSFSIPIPLNRVETWEQFLDNRPSELKYSSPAKMWRMYGIFSEKAGGWQLAVYQIYAAKARMDRDLRRLFFNGHS